MNRSMPWFRVWLMALCMVVLSLCSVELFARALGHKPTIQDGPDLWSSWRAKAEGADPNTVVLVGASRILLGFDIPTWKARFPDHEVIQLAIEGSWPITVLEDLANDESFGGTVICSIASSNFVLRSTDGGEWVRHYHRRWGVALKFVRTVRNFLQSHFVIFHAQALPQRLLEGLVHGSLPDVWFLTTGVDRSSRADYTIADIDTNKTELVVREEYANAPPVTPEKIEHTLSHMADLVNRIEGRGGKVIFVNYVVTGARLEERERYLPRRLFWDRIAEETGTFTLHFQDDPKLSQFDCPEFSHLDFRDVEEYTNGLADALIRIGAIAAPE